MKHHPSALGTFRQEQSYEGSTKQCPRVAGKCVHTCVCVCVCVCTRAGACRAEQLRGPAPAGWMLWGWPQEGEGSPGKRGVLAQAGGRVLPGTPIPSPSVALNFCNGSACTGLCSQGRGRMPRRGPRLIPFAQLLISSLPWALGSNVPGWRAMSHSVTTALVVNWAAKLTQ